MNKEREIPCQQYQLIYGPQGPCKHCYAFLPCLHYHFMCSVRLSALALFGALIFLSPPTRALQPLMGDRSSTISFAKNDFQLSDEAKEDLRQHLSCFNTLSSGVVIVIAYGDSASPSPTEAEQIELASHRAAAIRKFLVDSGLPYNRVYSEARAAGDVPLGHRSDDQFGRQSEGVANIESAGTCRIIEACRIICRNDR